MSGPALISLSVERDHVLHQHSIGKMRGLVELCIEAYFQKISLDPLAYNFAAISISTLISLTIASLICSKCLLLLALWCVPKLRLS